MIWFRRLRVTALVSAALALAAPATALAQEAPPLPIPEIPGISLPELRETGDPAVDAAVRSARVIAETPSRVQDEVNAALIEQRSLGLQRALAIAAQVGAPTCAQLGALAATAGGGLGLDTSVLSPLGSGVTAPVTKVDRDTNKVLMEYYRQALTAPSTPLDATLPPLADAQATLALLAIDWRTTYSKGGTPRTFHTPGYLNLPILLDVDGNLSFDLCAVTALDLESGQVTQQISKLPNAAAYLGVDVVAEYLDGAFASGYETLGSSAPAGFSTELQLAPSEVVTDLASPGYRFAQVHSLTSELQYRWSATRPPSRLTFSTQQLSHRGVGTVIRYGGSARSDRLAYSVKLGTANLGFAATPGPLGLYYCYSSAATCGWPGAKGSVELYASDMMRFDVTSGGTPAPGSECPPYALLGNEIHVSAAWLQFSANPATAAGHTNLNVQTRTLDSTAKAPGCMALTPAVTGPVLNLPTGFDFVHRHTTWATPVGATSPLTTGKYGRAKCPPGTSVTALQGAVSLTGYVCPVPPVSTAAPTLAGQPHVGAELVAEPGTWTPAPTDPDAPAFSYQWQRCDAGGGSCAPIAGATSAARTVTAEDAGHRLRAVVTAKNWDGTVSAATEPTGAIALPPASQ